GGIQLGEAEQVLRFIRGDQYDRVTRRETRRDVFRGPLHVRRQLVELPVLVEESPERRQIAAPGLTYMSHASFPRNLLIGIRHSTCTPVRMPAHRRASTPGRSKLRGVCLALLPHTPWKTAHEQHPGGLGAGCRLVRTGEWYPATDLPRPGPL